MALSFKRNKIAVSSILSYIIHEVLKFIKTIRHPRIKQLSYILLLAFGLSLFLKAAPAYADVASLSLTPSSQTVTEGDIVSLTLNVNSNTDAHSPYTPVKAQEAA
jgi:hypothetical protein